MKKVMNLFTLMMVASAFGISIRNLPVIAKAELHMFFFGIVAVICFYIPIALTSAELATLFPKMGGIIIWVKEAFGKKLGFFAIWLQWSYMNIGIISMLYFVAGTVSYLIDPALVNNKLFLIIVTQTVVWTFTFFNLKGLKLSSKISKYGFLIGVFFPAILLIVFGTFHYFTSNTFNIDLTFKKENLLPDFSNFSSLVILVGFMRAFGGIEVSAVHANNVENPKRNYPIAILFVAFLCFFINIVGSLSLSFVTVPFNISLIGGVMNGFYVYLNNYNLAFFIPVIVICIALGQMGQISTWLSGPINGIYEATLEMHSDHYFTKLNKNNVPSNLMILQSLLITFISISFLVFNKNVNMAFWISTALAMMVYFTMYFLMILSCLYLRYKKPDMERRFKIPFKNYGIWFISILGMASILFSYFIAINPPIQIEGFYKQNYQLILLFCILFIYICPFIISKEKL